MTDLTRERAQKEEAAMSEFPIQSADERPPCAFCGEPQAFHPNGTWYCSDASCDGYSLPFSSLASAAEQTPEKERVIYLDMLMAERLRTWARNINESGGHDITIWGRPQFVSEEMVRMADDIEGAVKVEGHAAALDAQVEALKRVLENGAFDELTLRHYGKMALTNSEVRMLQSRVDKAEARAEQAEARLTALTDANATLREQLSNHCACEHDGRGNLTSECQEHEEQRQSLAIHEKALTDLASAVNALEEKLRQKRDVALREGWRQQASAYESCADDLAQLREPHP